MWFVLLFSFHYFLGNVVAAPLGRLALVMYVPLLIMTAVQGPVLVAWAKAWSWYPPFALLLAVSAVTIPWAANRPAALEVTQQLLFFYVIAVATVVYVRTPRHAVPIVGLLVWQFAWWALFGRLKAQVSWHPGLVNYDGFGAGMVMGAGICFWFGKAARSTYVKWLLFMLSAYCVVGVVVSLARGAFLSLILVAAFTWYRSPRKVQTALGVAAAMLVIVVSSALLFPGGAFWNEMRSVFEEGTSGGTGGLRWDLWKAALEVFKARPILGVGGKNFGPFASTYFLSGELERFPQPTMLYSFNLHNGYVQILAELGLVGFAAFMWLVVDFYRRNRALHEPAALQHWAAHSGGGFDLRYVATGLEVANFANLLSGLVYAGVFEPWFYTVWAVNRMLWAVTRGNEADPLPARAGSRTPRSVRRGDDRPVIPGNNVNSSVWSVGGRDARRSRGR